MNSALRSSWQRKQRSFPWNSSWYLKSEAWGLWQTLQSPAATGPWRNSLFVLSFSWQEKHSAEVVGLRIWNLESDWWGSWQAMQSPMATGPWM